MLPTVPVDGNISLQHVLQFNYRRFLMACRVANPRTYIARYVRKSFRVANPYMQTDPIRTYVSLLSQF